MALRNRTRRGIEGALGALLLGIASAGWAQAAAPAAPAAPPPPPDGLHTKPTVFWKAGPHRVDLGGVLRVRTEAWDAFSALHPDTDWYTATRTRVSLKYAYAGKFALNLEGQDVRIHGLDADLFGPGAIYRSMSGADSNTHGTSLRQAWAELKLGEGISVRGGRQDIKLGGEVTYAEPSWKYLKAARVGERLIGTVGWSHVERSNDGGTLSWDLGEHLLYGFAARPTTGVFDADSAYHPQRDVFFAGGAWTVKRGEWLPNTELGAFGIYYEDDREPVDGGLAEGLDVWTLGGSAVGVYPVGPGQLDALAWVAGQGGDYNGLDHGAVAGIVEAGYQLTGVFAKPWLRLGINVASGDSDPTDGKHDTFFNLMPTNHLYYGFADQLAFQNLKDLFVQLRLFPHAKLSLNAFIHYFSLMDAADSRYAGTGAFNRKSFGYVASSSLGARTVGTEYDLIATLPIHPNATLELGFNHLEAGRMFPEDIDFGYVSVDFKY